ncbi:SRF-type transcription factor (DNA-binding and dimerization domain)-domain-containing protein, partial [Catenaria anguillulae PL171]
RRTSIAPIKTAKNRRLTFSKRRQGLFKKGHEIAVLCQAEVLIVLRDVRGRVFQFA